MQTVILGIPSHIEQYGRAGEEVLLLHGWGSHAARFGSFVEPMLAAGADTIVLACTHYPFALDAIQRIAGPRVTVIDPAPAIARHLGDVLGSRQLRNGSGSRATHRFLTTGDPASLRAAVHRWCGIDGEIGALRWTEDDSELVFA